jgi:hypothetical protein
MTRNQFRFAFAAVRDFAHLEEGRHPSFAESQFYVEELLPEEARETAYRALNARRANTDPRSRKLILATWFLHDRRARKASEQAVAEDEGDWDEIPF